MLPQTPQPNEAEVAAVRAELYRDLVPLEVFAAAWETSVKTVRKRFAITKVGKREFVHLPQARERMLAGSPRKELNAAA
jgi:hypothetical protein